MLEAHNIDRYHNKDIAAMAEKHKDLHKRAILLAVDKAAMAVYIVAVAVVVDIAAVAVANKVDYNNNLALF